jgi:pyrroline-5-carboxylate reductase
MGEALLAGLIAAGRPAGEIVVVDTPARVEELTARHGVRGVTLEDAPAAADVLVVAVKPQDVAGVLTALAPGIDPARHLVVSVAAGIPTSRLEAPLPNGTPVVRVMPNTPALVGQGMSVLSAGSSAGPAHLDAVDALLSSVGRVLRVPESQQDAVTAVSGSGPAYVFLVVEAMTDAGVLLGLPRAVAAELAAQTVLGAGTMLAETGDSATALRVAVTSPGGTTAAALAELEKQGLRSAFLGALTAARDRSAELAGPTP